MIREVRLIFPLYFRVDQKLLENIVQDITGESAPRPARVLAIENLDQKTVESLLIYFPKVLVEKIVPEQNKENIILFDP